VAGEFLFTWIYDVRIGNAAMNSLNFTCIFLLTLLLPVTIFASSLKFLFTPDELAEMGVCLETPEREGE
jgi:hypothetical protein